MNKNSNNDEQSQKIDALLTINNFQTQANIIK
jgi:hypothetical protein